MKSLIILLCGLCISMAAWSQSKDLPGGDKQTESENKSTTRPKSGSKKKTKPVVIGIQCGLQYSQLKMESSPYFLEDGDGKTGKVSVQDMPGITAGFHVMFNKYRVRASLEASIMPSEIAYETGKANAQEEHWIYPVTIELPITYFSPRLHGEKSSKKFNPGLFGSVRFIVPISKFHDDIPTQNPFNLNLDAGLRIPLNFKGFSSALEFFYSFGMLNIIESGKEDYRNHVIQSMRKDFAGIRMYIN